jgi:two-component system, OmpR family, sensor histidine kinase VicK
MGDGPGREFPEPAAPSVSRDEQHALLAAVVQAMPAGVVAVEAETGRLVIANDEARRIFGVPETAAQFVGVERWTATRRDGTQYSSEDWPIARSLRRGETVQGEVVELVRADGERMVLEVRSVPIPNDDGRTAMAVAVFQDVTQRERRERAEREFITNAAHELLTPLAGITSAVEVLQGGAKEVPEQRDRFLAHAERETVRLGRLARALLVLARAEMGTETPRAELVPLAPLLDEVVSGLQPVRGVSVEIECPPELALIANRELALQALVNVGENAVKFTSAGEIGFHAYGDESRVVVEVSDPGAGIPDGDKARVFDRFYRSAESPAREGFGLGLAIARQAVEAIGGRIELESQRGRGTTVSLTLPGARLTGR